MTRSGSSTVILVFAKAPVPGTVKTRLIPAVGAEAAARLHRAFLEDVCATVGGIDARRVLAVAGEADEWMRGVAARATMALAGQGDGDLGARMRRAIRGALDGGARRALVLGSDSPLVTVELVGRALALLDETEVVLGPAEDGGYWTIGARVDAAEAFDGIAWGTPSVLAETRARLAAAGRPHRLADPFWDVDEPADLDRLRRALAAAPPSLAPSMRAVLATL